MLTFTKIRLKFMLGYWFSLFFIIGSGVLCQAASFLEEAHRQPIPPSFLNSPSYGEFNDLTQ